MAEIKSIKKNAFYAFLKAFSSLIFPIITFPYASRILLPEGIGKVNFANSVAYFFIILGMLGIEAYGTREVSKVKNDKEKLSKLAREIMVINLISMIVAYSLFLILILSVPKLKEYRILLFVCSSYIVVSPLGLEWLYKGLEEFKFITIRTFIFQCIALVFLFTMVRTPEDTISYTIFGVLTGVGSNVLNLVHSPKVIDYKIRVKLDIKKHLKYIFIFFGMAIVNTLYASLDTTFLGFLSTDTEVGFYAAATKINRMVVGVITATSAVLLPRLSYYSENNQKEEFQKLFKTSINIILLISIPMVFGLIGTSDVLIYTFCGPNYTEAIPVMRIITPIVFNLALTGIIGTQLAPAINKEKFSLFSYILGATSNIILNSLLIPKYGAFGAGVATLISETLVMIFQVIFITGFFFDKDMVINLVESLIGSLLMLVVVMLENKYITLSQTASVNNILKLFLMIVSGIVVYFIFLLVTKNKYLFKITSKISSKIKKQ